MRVFRVAQKQHAASVEEMLSGEGAAIYGGRWNSVGVPAVYCSESISLCALEILVHLPRGVLRRYKYVEIDVPDAELTFLDLDPRDAGIDRTVVGDRLLGPSGVLGFQVASAVNPTERNIVLNPAHADFSNLRCGHIKDFPIDPRLTGR